MAIEVTEPPTTTTEVLIPEARRHKRVRLMRLGILLALYVLLLIAAVVASAVVFTGGDTKGKSQPGANAAAAPRGAVPTAHVYFRPVLCIAPPYSAPGAVPSPPAAPACSPGSLLSATGLNVEPNGSSPSGFTSENVAPDAALASVPSTKPSADRPSATVLLPGLRDACSAEGFRCVLGPAEMSSSSIRAATVKHEAGLWVVDYSTTSRGAALWDRVAENNFHMQLAIEVNGVVFSAPLIQPTQSSFTSFGGRGEIGGSLTRVQATDLAKAMDPRSE